MMIFCVWTAAVIVSLAPQFGWKDPDYLQRIEQQKCMVSQDVSYQVGRQKRKPLFIQAFPVLTPSRPCPFVLDRGLAGIYWLVP